MNIFKRYQKGLTLGDFYPKAEGVCACGCGETLTGKKTKWASRECNDKVYALFAILKGNTNAIRKALFQIDKGFCRECGAYDESWQADHILPVFLGGGWSDLSNFQTLCTCCHKDKTKHQTISHLSSISLQESVRASNVLLYALGEKA